MDFPLPAFRTVTQEDPGDNQVTLEEVTQTVREETEETLPHILMTKYPFKMTCSAAQLVYSMTFVDDDDEEQCQLLNYMRVLCIRLCRTVRQNRLKTTLLWRSLSNSHCLTTWSSRSFLMSKCMCMCTDTQNNL